MEHYTVEGRDQFVAALLAAAQPTFAEAAANPFKIELLNTHFVYMAPRGIQQARAEQMARRINKTPRGAWTC